MFAGLSRGWVFRHHSLLTRASSWRTAATADQAATRPSRHGEGGEEGRERPVEGQGSVLCRLPQPYVSDLAPPSVQLGRGHGFMGRAPGQGAAPQTVLVDRRPGWLWLGYRGHASRSRGSSRSGNPRVRGAHPTTGRPCRRSGRSQVRNGMATFSINYERNTYKQSI